MPGGRLAAVRPYPQPFAGGGQQGRAHGPSVPATAQGRVHDELGGRGLHRVGVLQLPVSGEPAALGEQEVPDALARSAAQLEPSLFGHGGGAVRTRRVLDEFEYGDRLFLRQLVESLNLPSRLQGRCCVSHGTSLRPPRGRGGVRARGRSFFCA